MAGKVEKWNHCSSPGWVVSSSPLSSTDSTNLEREGETSPAILHRKTIVLNILLICVSAFIKCAVRGIGVQPPSFQLHGSVGNAFRSCKYWIDVIQCGFVKVGGFQRHVPCLGELLPIKRSIFFMEQKNCVHCWYDSTTLSPLSQVRTLLRPMFLSSLFALELHTEKRFSMSTKFRHKTSTHHTNNHLQLKQSSQT